LLRIDPSDGKVDTIARLDKSPCEITVAFGSLWVVTQSGRLDRVDPRRGRVTARIKVGAASYQAVATPGALWVSNRNDGTLSQVDPTTDRVVRTVHLEGVQPGGMVFAGGSLWVGDDTTGNTEVLRLDPQTRRLTKVTAGSRPAYLTTTPGAVWVSNVSDGTVSRIDLATGKQTATLDVGLSPVNLKSAGHGTDVWVPDDVGNQVVRIDPGATRVVGRLQAEGGPAVVRAAFGDIWVTMFGIGQVWRVHPA
jgi:DNA-binding beta-propeller fold protein YncE